jgi:hypothetical protein
MFGTRDAELEEGSQDALPNISYTLQHLYHDAAAIHQSMVCAAHNLNATTAWSHGAFHPANRILCNLFVTITVPHAYGMRVCRIREFPRLLIMV